MPGQIQSLKLQSVLMETRSDIEPFEENLSPATFGAVYRRYLDPVYRYLLARVGSVPDAEDLTSQVFLAALERLPRYQPRGSFAAWLFSIARRKAADHFRRGAKTQPLEGMAEPAAPEVDALAQVIQKEDLNRLVRLTARLDEDERELLRLRFAARLSFDEMAVVLNRKTQAVKMSLYRLLDRMQIELEANHD